MSKLTSNIAVFPVSLFNNSTTTYDGTDLGAEGTAGDGRYYRWALVGSSTNLVAGTLLQGPAQDATNWQNLVVSAASTGATEITVTSTVTTTANSLAGGLMIVRTGTGDGFTYEIAGNTAASSSGFTITLVDPLLAALDSTSRVDAQPNPYNGVIINPTTPTSAPVGVAITNSTKGTYNFIQTRGPVALLAKGAITAGQSVVASVVTAGAVSAAAGNAYPIIGTALEGIADGDYGLVFLTLS